VKVKNYEKKDLVILSTIIIIILEIIFLIYLCTTKIYTYQKISSIVVKDNLVTVIVSNKDRKLLYKNKKLFLNNKHLKYVIEKDNGLILKKDKKYYQLLLKLNFDGHYKANDVLELTIADKKEPIIKMLKKIWEGDD